MYDSALPPSAERSTDTLAVHDSSIPSTARIDGIRQVHEWYRLARHVWASQSNAVEPANSSVEKWLAGLEAPILHEQGKRSIIMTKIALLTGTKTKLQTRSTPLTVIVANVA